MLCYIIVIPYMKRIKDITVHKWNIFWEGCVILKNAEFEKFMDELTAKEEERLGIGSLEFLQRHKEIMDGCDRQLLHDLHLEQIERM